MKLFVKESSWSGWTENYKPKEIDYEFELKHGQTYEIGKIKTMSSGDSDWKEEPKIIISIKKIKDDFIIIKTNKQMCLEYISFNQTDNKFIIKQGQTIKLITPSRDCGDIFYISYDTPAAPTQNVYDNEKFYNDYIAMREDHNNNANDLLEIPVMKELLPDLKGKKVLDLGCGYGEMSKYFIDQGAKKVVACDISQNMLNLAKKLNSHENIEYKLLAMENLNQLNEKFDIVFSSLAFHYIEDFDKLIKDINNRLNKKGILLYSIEHPIVTAVKISETKKNKLDIDGKRFYLLSDYNVEGIRDRNWNVAGVIKYHRTFKTNINTLIKNGFEIVCVEESTARPEAVEKVAKYIYQNDKPYFLFVKAKKK